MWTLFQPNWNVYIQCLVWLPLSEGWGASCPGGLILPPTQDLGQTMSSVNFYCTIILDYLVVRDINIITVKLKCLHPMFSLVILVQGLRGKLSRLVYLAPCPEFGSGSVISEFLLHHNLGIFSCMRYKHYLGQTEMFASNVQFDYPCPRGGGQAFQAGLSCPSPHPPTQDFCQTLSSVNSYCTIILEYLVVRDINIISVKLRCLHPTFSLVTLVRRVGGKMSRLVYLAPSPHPPPPAKDLDRTASWVNFYCTIILEYLVLREVNIISAKLRCLHPTSVWLPLSEGWGARCPGWFILNPPPAPA